MFKVVCLLVMSHRTLLWLAGAGVLPALLKSTVVCHTDILLSLKTTLHVATAAPAPCMHPVSGLM